MLSYIGCLSTVIRSCLNNMNPNRLFTLLLCLLSVVSVSQETLVPVNREYDGLLVKSFIQRLEAEKGVQIFYEPESLDGLFVRIKQDSIPLLEVLRNNLTNKGFQVYSDSKGNYFCYRSIHLKTSLPDDFFKLTGGMTPAPKAGDTLIEEEQDPGYLKTYDDYISEKVTIGKAAENGNSKYARISGFVTSSDNREPIPQATLSIKEINKHTTTDVSGYYSIRLQKGQYTLSVKSMGSHEKKYRIKVLSDGNLNVSLETKTYMIRETVITARRNDNVSATSLGMEKLTTQTIKQMPVVMGEQDIIKAALMLPGVQSINEASSGFNVRGSPSDQNMFYINNLPVYNVSHLFGMFTAFNPDAVNEFSLYKSSIPVSYGGHLSSIFDIEAKQGNMKEFSARGGISPVTTRMIVEGPLLKDTISYLFGMRSTYSNWVLKEIKDVSISNSSASFADALANITHKAGKNDQFNLFAYTSRDRSDLTIGLNNTYSNTGASLQWMHQFNRKHRSTLSLVHSNYHFREEKDEIDYIASKQSFDLNHTEATLDFRMDHSENHHLQYGINGVLYQLQRGDLLPLGPMSNLKKIDFEPDRGLSISLFASNEWEIFPKLTLYGGLRATQYNSLGPATVYSYANRQPRETDNITDSTKYAGNESISTYNNLDYRVSIQYLIDDELSIKAGYNRLHQYIFLLSSTISISPTDQWKLADQHIRPMKGAQFSAGIYKNFPGAHLELSLEGYYKKVDHLVEIKDGADITYSRHPETNIIQGNLDAYGVEFMLRKTAGQLNGWVNYTWSNTSVQAVNPRRNERINLGYSYPANYDKPHAFNLTMNYKFSKRWSFSANAIYATGRPITYPKSIYYQNGIQITGFSRRNEARLPEYFRTDLSFHYEGNLKKDKFAHGSWSLSFFNLTGRKNPYSVYFRNEDGEIKGYQLSIFGAVIPSITYHLKLGNYED